MIPDYLAELLRAAMVGDWYGNLILGAWAVLVGSLLVVVVALARARR